MKKQTILITGSSGFIGRHLSKILYQDYNIITPDRYELNLLYTDLVKDCLERYKPDIIIHLAGISSPAKLLNSTELFDINILGTQRIIEYTPPGCRFIFASSIVCGGTAINLHNENSVLNPTSLYGASKGAAEHIINAYTNLGKINGISLRLCATMGSGLTHGVIKDFVERAKAKTNPFLVMGSDPGSIKPYLHISDVIKAFQAAIKHDTIHGAINITNTQLLSIKEIAHIILDYYNSNSKVEFTGQNFAGDNSMLNYSNSLAKQLLEWKPRLNSYDAIIKTLDDFQLEEELITHDPN